MRLAAAVGRVDLALAIVSLLFAFRQTLAFSSTGRSLRRTVCHPVGTASWNSRSPASLGHCIGTWRLQSQNSDDAETAEQPPSLLLTADDVAQQMARLRNKYPTSEADYLAAARARSAAKTASVERAASDQDFQELARQKLQAYGSVDDWEQSQSEAGNSDSQILIPMNLMNEGEDDDNEAGEPKLLLF